MSGGGLDNAEVLSLLFFQGRSLLRKKAPRLAENQSTAKERTKTRSGRSIRLFIWFLPEESLAVLLVVGGA